jgi:hypothetical protein
MNDNRNNTITSGTQRTLTVHLEAENGVSYPVRVVFNAPQGLRAF